MLVVMYFGSVFDVFNFWFFLILRIVEVDVKGKVIFKVKVKVGGYGLVDVGVSGSVNGIV